jgi:uncharacterized membrane protein YozB (DUF420 family)
MAFVWVETRPVTVIDILQLASIDILGPNVIEMVFWAQGNGELWRIVGLGLNDVLKTNSGAALLSGLVLIKTEELEPHKEATTAWEACPLAGLVTLKEMV